jgi:hypothetical protein
VAVAVVIAGAMTACAALEGLDGYKACLADCDAGGGSAVDRGRDATGGDAPANSDDAGDMSDEGVGSEPTEIDAGGTDASRAGEAGSDASIVDASDGAPPLCATLADVDGGLLVYYPFEGNATDGSGNGRNGVASGTDIAYGAGKVGQAVSILDGGQGVGVTGTTSLAGAKTLCAWVRPASGTSGAALPVFVGGSNFYDIEPASSPTAGGCTVAANTMFMDNGACSATALAIMPGQWSLVCYAYNVGSTTFFANGSSQTVSGAQYDPYTLAQITIGSDRIGGSTTRSLFVGQIDEVSIWSTSLSKADMNALYNGGGGCRIR